MEVYELESTSSLAEDSRDNSLKINILKSQCPIKFTLQNSLYIYIVSVRTISVRTIKGSSSYIKDVKDFNIYIYNIYIDVKDFNIYNIYIYI